VQILYGRRGGNDIWTVWSGPQGIAVDPCKVEPEPFQFEIQAAGQFGGGSLEQLYFPPKVIWPADFVGDGCTIKGNGQDGPPTLVCKQSLVVGFQKDAQFNDQEIVCDNGARYHRGWAAEL
jgi:hypothetical protein